MWKTNSGKPKNMWVRDDSSFFMSFHLIISVLLCDGCTRKESTAISYTPTVRPKRWLSRSVAWDLEPKPPSSSPDQRSQVREPGGGGGRGLNRI
jgi:hypothetical protein